MNYHMAWHLCATLVIWNIQHKDYLDGPFCMVAKQCVSSHLTSYITKDIKRNGFVPQNNIKKYLEAGKETPKKISKSVFRNHVLLL